LIRNTNNDFVGNSVAGSSDYGFWFGRNKKDLFEKSDGKFFNNTAHVIRKSSLKIASESIYSGYKNRNGFVKKIDKFISYDSWKGIISRTLGK